jgi:hypothetical protein
MDRQRRTVKRENSQDDWGEGERSNSAMLQRMLQKRPLIHKMPRPGERRPPRSGETGERAADQEKKEPSSDRGRQHMPMEEEDCDASENHVPATLLPPQQASKSERAPDQGRLERTAKLLEVEQGAVLERAREGRVDNQTRVEQAFKEQGGLARFGLTDFEWLSMAAELPRKERLEGVRSKRCTDIEAPQQKEETGKLPAAFQDLPKHENFHGLFVDGGKSADGFLAREPSYFAGMEKGFKALLASKGSSPAAQLELLNMNALWGVQNSDGADELPDKMVGVRDRVSVQFGISEAMGNATKKGLEELGERTKKGGLLHGHSSLLAPKET